MSNLFPTIELTGNEILQADQLGVMLSDLGWAKTYAATISQTSTNTPVAVLSLNTIGSGVWTRVDSTHYELAITGAFPAARTFFNTGVDPDGNYLYWIDADTMGFFAAGGDGSITNYPVKIQVYPLVMMDMPENFTATNFDEGQNDLAWDAVTGADGYIVEVDTDSSFGAPFMIYNNTTNSFSHAGLIQETDYYYRVKAYKSGYKDSFYNTANATTIAP